MDAEVKRATLNEERAALDGGHVVAIGDGANDLRMLDAADLGVAYHAKPVVADAADARIDHGDLRAVLWGLGFSRADWVDA